jgi:uncharacterized membrane protein
MTRTLLFIAAGAIFGLITHVVTIMAVPLNATRDAYSRITQVAEAGRFVEVGADPEQGDLPYLDPTFVHAACLYDLTLGPLSVRVPELPSYFAVVFHDRLARPFFVINDRAAIGGAIEALVVDPVQAALAMPSETGTRVETQERVGFVLIRAAVANPTERQRVMTDMAGATCQQVALTR